MLRFLLMGLTLLGLAVAAPGGEGPALLRTGTYVPAVPERMSVAWFEYRPGMLHLHWLNPAEDEAPLWLHVPSRAGRAGVLVMEPDRGEYQTLVYQPVPEGVLVKYLNLRRGDEARRWTRQPLTEGDLYVRREVGR